MIRVSAVSEPGSSGHPTVTAAMPFSRRNRAVPGGRVEGDAGLDELAGALDERDLLLEAARRHERGLDRKPEADGPEGLQEGLVEVLAHAADLAGRRHLDADARIGARGGSRTRTAAP